MRSGPKASVSRRAIAHGRSPRSIAHERPFPLDERRQRCGQRASFEPDAIPGRQLARESNVSRDDRRQVGITAGRLPIGHQQNRLTRGRLPAGPQAAAASGNDVRAAGVCRRGPASPESHRSDWLVIRVIRRLEQIQGIPAEKPIGGGPGSTRIRRLCHLPAVPHQRIALVAVDPEDREEVNRLPPTLGLRLRRSG